MVQEFIAFHRIGALDWPGLNVSPNLNPVIDHQHVWNELNVGSCFFRYPRLVNHGCRRVGSEQVNDSDRMQLSNVGMASITRLNAMIIDDGDSSTLVVY